MQTLVLAILLLGSSIARAQDVPTTHPATDRATVSADDSARAVAALRDFLRSASTADVADQAFAAVPLRRDDADRAHGLLWTAHVAKVRREREAEMAARTLEAAPARLHFWFKTFGDKPAKGRALWISLHGGGAASTVVNDRQWENQKRLYQPAEGVYVAPRAPTDTWDLWHLPHVDRLFDRLIENLIAFEDVDPDRVYLMGYSAGGDGVYQLAPRLADRWAAAAMMAGHPNDARPDNLRNIGFALDVGGLDAAYGRNDVAKTWKGLLEDLAAADPGGYRHRVVIHADKGHWMDRADAAALPWMATCTRDPRPAKIVWLQDDVTQPRLYWLATPEPVARTRLVAERSGQTVKIVSGPASPPVHVRLDDTMVDLDRDVTLEIDDRLAFKGRPPRTIGVLARTLAERGDPRGMYCAEIRDPR